MSAASASPPPPAIMEPLCAVFRRALRNEGLKYTPERAQVLDAILAFDGLFEAEQLIDSLKADGRRVSKATVYRTIKLLQDAGIIQRVPFDDEQAHYHVAYGRGPEDLIIRLDTREMIVADVPELIPLREALCERMGLTCRGHRLHIFAERMTPADERVTPSSPTPGPSSPQARPAPAR